jgi:hypothetical protein
VGNYGYGVGGAYVYESETGAPVRITGNSFVGNASGAGPSSLLLLNYTAPENMIVKSNQFDGSVDRPVIDCSFGIVIDESNVFASGRDTALSGGCVAAE